MGKLNPFCFDAFLAGFPQWAAADHRQNTTLAANSCTWEGAEFWYGYMDIWTWDRGLVDFRIAESIGATNIISASIAQALCHSLYII